LPAPGRKKTPKGEANISSLWPLAKEGFWPGGKREAGRDFQSAKILQIPISSIKGKGA